jgi:hypothetical protein
MRPQKGREGEVKFDVLVSRIHCMMRSFNMSRRRARGTVCANLAVSAKIANLTLALFRLPVPPYKEGDIPSRERRGR